MKIIVCVKEVPDTAAKVVVEDGQVSWGDASLVINPWDEFAVEAALQLSDAHNGEVQVLCVGGDQSMEAIKHALAMGAGSAVLVSDENLKGLDSQGVARVLASAVQKIGDADLVLFGKQAVDGEGGVTASQAARVLGVPALTLTAAIVEADPDAGTIKVERSIEEGRQVVEGKFPAVMSVVKDFGEPRYPSFMGIRKASRAKVPTWTLEDLGIEAPAAVVDWPELMNPPERDVTCEIITGDSHQEIGEKLADRLIEEKVI